MKKIIVTGHGHYATGMQGALDLLAGKNEDVYFVNFTEGDSDTTLKEKLMTIINAHAESDILFFCDLIGGTPYKVAATLSYENDRLEVVAGCNIGSLLDAVFTKENHTISTLAHHVVSVSKEATGVFEKRSKTDSEDLLTDGI
ncbi:PTS sugar transporter subunit IIA [Aneurinibacillus terranovensis]|uniref:PTS sugar transporter subunit IIA n=1 Tax=Aneurinibacillus terranovensis TaxID=278991 RepID=UPI0003F6873D|nr:PTS sugar transporter subunit IIA [Aneurinibacillus terranovensis]